MTLGLILVSVNNWHKQQRCSPARFVSIIFPLQPFLIEGVLSSKNLDKIDLGFLIGGLRLVCQIKSGSDQKILWAVNECPQQNL